MCVSTAHAVTRLVTPEDLEIEQLNIEQKDKFQNVDYTETVAIPNQYKGKLKYTEGKEEVHLKDVRLFFGAGGRYTIAKDAELNADSVPDDMRDSTYFNKQNTWSFDNNFNFYASMGLYWRNGIRIEFEYSQMTLETNNYGKEFEERNGFIFNQYLQTSGKITDFYDSNGELAYTTLTNNMLPIVEFSVKTYMLNFIFEKTQIKSKIRPYVGFGVGAVVGNMKSLVNDGESVVFGGQVMVGLSYPFSDDDSLIMYFGYRGIFSQDMEQTFTRIYDVNLIGVVTNQDVNDFDGRTYYNPQFFKSKERFGFQAHNIDLGVKFYF